MLGENLSLDLIHMFTREDRLMVHFDQYSFDTECDWFTP